ncbi:MAG: hypothetical protein GY946_00610 [bacterium]|nr:hypothetical protein [bacterium]
MQNRSRRSRAHNLIWTGALLLLTACGDSDANRSFAPVEADQWSSAISHIFLKAGTRDKQEAARDLIYEIHARLQAGESFADLARKHSQEGNARDGGFAGFQLGFAENRISGVIQALPIGVASRPFRTREGFNILYRHPFEEARALEKRNWVPIYGFFLPYEGLDRGKLPREQVEKAAQLMYADLIAGKTTLRALRDEHVPPMRGQAQRILLTFQSRTNLKEDVRTAIESVKPGEYVPPFSTPMGIGVLRRGRYLRGVVRQILVMHRDSFDRPLRISRSRNEALAGAKKALATLRPDLSNWGAVLKAYTDDDLAARPNGTVGVVGPGDMPLATEEAAIDTPVGTLHPEVVESEYGFHVIWRVS